MTKKFREVLDLMVYEGIGLKEILVRTEELAKENQEFREHKVVSYLIDSNRPETRRYKPEYNEILKERIDTERNPERLNKAHHKGINLGGNGRDYGIKIGSSRTRQISRKGLSE